MLKKKKKKIYIYIYTYTYIGGWGCEFVAKTPRTGKSDRRTLGSVRVVRVRAVFAAVSAAAGPLLIIRSLNSFKLVRACKKVQGSV